MTTTCPLCHQPTTHEQLPVELDDDGLPYAVAMTPGFGVPVADPTSMRFRVFLDGQKAEHVIGFDRRAGVIWRYVEVDGLFVRDGDKLHIEQVSGAVTLKKGWDQ